MSSRDGSSSRRRSERADDGGDYEDHYRSRHSKQPRIDSSRRDLDRSDDRDRHRHREDRHRDERHRDADRHGDRTDDRHRSRHHDSDSRHHSRSDRDDRDRYRESSRGDEGRSRDDDGAPRRRRRGFGDAPPSSSSPAPARSDGSGLPARPAFAGLPARPVTDIPPAPTASSIVNAPTANGSTAAPTGFAEVKGKGAPAGPVDEKQKKNKERLEAWRKEREAKKALEEARQRAAMVAAAYGGAGSTTAPTALKTTASGPTTISAKGLKGISLKPNAFDKGKPAAASALADTLDVPVKKELKRFALPPIDPLLKPGAGGKVGAGSDLEDGDDDDDIDDELPPAIASIGATASNKMDEDEEDDPLDAFMASVSKEVKQVDEEDRKRVGFTRPARTLAEVVGKADDEGGEEEPTKRDDDDDLEDADAEDILALAAKKVKKKELPATDHSKVDYEPFDKAFYHPPSEVEEMSEEDAERLRMELDAIKVRGKDCPKPLTKWSYCGLPSACLDVIKRLEYKAPTAIQAQAIPAIMSGRDIIGVAKTGSGKTMAFLLPMFRHIKAQRPVESLEGPIGIVLTPTRELAVQIYRESKPFLKSIGLRAACVYGGAPISEQIAEMKRTAEIVVATPGRMIDLLMANSGRVTNLRRVTYLVLDEADRMFDMGFEPQVMKIINNIRPDRQTVLFSATFPKQMESLARKVLRHKPVEIVVGGRSVVAPEIEQIVEVREEESKFHRLLEILGQTYNNDEDARTLVFVERQESADDLLKELIRKGYPTMSLHGGKDQVDRDATIADFKAGVVPIVTATSVAARGLDVKQLKLVVNYDAPNHMEDYVHRAGRTGRAGNKGTCITFITPQQDRYARDIIAALKASKQAVPPELQKLADDFKDKVAAGKAQAAGSGFGGKGLERLESDRERVLAAQRSAYGEAGGAAAGDAKQGVDANEAAASASALDIKVQRGPAPSDEQLADIKVEVRRGAAPDSVRDNKVKASGAGAEPGTDEAAEKDKADNALIERNKAILEAAKAKGADTTQLAVALAKISEMAEKRKRERQEEERTRERRPKDPDATEFHACIVINDFPQRARWRVTNKETMSTLIQVTGASVTLKGVFYEKGKEPAAGEPPKLQLLIESNDESKVEHAVRDVKGLLLEATQAALEAEQRGPPGGQGGPARYTVV